MFEVEGCKFVIERDIGRIVYFKDVGYLQNGDIPVGAVAEDIFNWLYIRYGDKIFLYRDQYGGVDELRHCGGVFSGVGPYSDKYTY